MEVLQEGLRTYQIKKEVENTYYLSVEYEMIKRNSLKMLLPVQLREKDGEECLLFDITGRQSLDEFRKEQGFSYQECREILQALICLIQEIDDYMLDFKYVSLYPEHIYVKNGQDYQWMYLPDDENEVQESAEKFFAWMLKRIDYEDARGVPFVYSVFGEIRKHGFSKELLERCLKNEPKEEEKDEPGKDDLFEPGNREFVTEGWSDNSAEYDKLQNFEEGKRENPLWEQEDEGKAENNDIRVHRGETIGTVVCLILAAGSAVVMGILIFEGMRTGFDEWRYRAAAGSIILFIVFLAIALGIRKRGAKSLKKRGERGQKRREKAAYPEHAVKQKSQYSEYKETWDEMEEEEPNEQEWVWQEDFSDNEEEEEGTVVLGVRRKALYPIIQAKETGIIYTVDRLPFYIGSGKTGNQMRIKDRTVSRQHAVILPGRQTGNYLMQDMGSTNGTWVDGVKIEREKKVALRDGMTLRFANREYEFLLRG